MEKQAKVAKYKIGDKLVIVGLGNGIEAKRGWNSQMNNYRGKVGLVTAVHIGPSSYYTWYILDCGGKWVYFEDLVRKATKWRMKKLKNGNDV